uniref:Inositol polyphosphate-4-phosphatase type II B n=1 Tax=Hippocampus comes TaxID=109280 RepID=A0A3Q2Z1G7_HIPCM
CHACFWNVACNDLLTSGPDGTPNTVVHVAVADPHKDRLLSHACTEIVEVTDPRFLTGVTLSSNCPTTPETLVKLTVYDVKDKSQEVVSKLFSMLPNAFIILTNSSLSPPYRSSDGGCAAGTVVVSRLKMGEMEEAEHITTDVPLCGLTWRPHGTYAINGSINGVLLMFTNPVCKVYRFQTADSKWMLVREQMEECTLSFSIPKQLLSLYMQEDMSRVQDLKELGELSPHWDNLRKEVITRYSGIISSYQETLAEMEKITGPSFKQSCCKAQKSLEFLPINLHTQRMRVTCPRKTDASYDIVTAGAPAAHFQGFKAGGLQRLLGRYEAEKKSFSTAYQCIYYSPEHTAKAQEVLSSVSLLQPLIGTLADQLLHAAHEHSSPSLREALKNLSDKTEQFVHTLKDELVKCALLALHTAQPGYVSKNQKSGERDPSPVRTASPLPPAVDEATLCNNVGSTQGLRRGDDSIPHHKEYDEEEWDRIWASVAKRLNCVIAMVDQLADQDERSKQECSGEQQQLADVITSHNPASDWREQLCPLVARLKECVAQVVDKAKRAVTFVLLQEAACSIPQGFLLQQRRDVVFSQALAVLACGFVMRVYAGMQDKGFLRQLHLVGLVAQFESLLSTYSEEIGMLEDMEVGVADLRRVVFKVTQARTDHLSDLQPVVRGRRDHFTVEVPLPGPAFQNMPEEIKEGRPLRVFPVLFNVGINEQQTIAERSVLRARDLGKKKYIYILGQNVVAKRRKNVEILWSAAAVCRRLNGIRFTSCKSAKDRTSMSVTLEQCALLRDEHQLSKDFFIRALDCMRREGCRMENVEKNIGCRKYAFNMLQLMAFPRSYRPPEGSYGKVDT